MNIIIKIGVGFLALWLLCLASETSRKHFNMDLGEMLGTTFIAILLFSLIGLIFYIVGQGIFLILGVE